MKLFRVATVLVLTLLIAPGVFAGEGVPQNDTLKVMSWNVKLLPRVLTFLHHHPVKRARHIAEPVIAENVDVVVFQEAFDHKALRLIKKKLQPVMPYIAGHIKGHALTKKSSGGVVIFSKYPIDTVAKVRYNNSVGPDKIGKKGSIMAEITKNGKKIQIIGTHMQAGGTHELKISQYHQMADLATACKKDGVPQLFCGDFNTHKADSTLYPVLIKTIDAQDGDIQGDQLYTTDHKLNDMEKYNPNKRGVIDYVFVKPNGMQPKSTYRYVRRFTYQWSKTHKDLSDHFAIINDIVF